MDAAQTTRSEGTTIHVKDLVRKVMGTFINCLGRLAGVVAKGAYDVVKWMFPASNVHKMTTAELEAYVESLLYDEQDSILSDQKTVDENELPETLESFANLIKFRSVEEKAHFCKSELDATKTGTGRAGRTVDVLGFVKHPDDRMGLVVRSGWFETQTIHAEGKKKITVSIHLCCLDACVRSSDAIFRLLGQERSEVDKIKISWTLKDCIQSIMINRKNRKDATKAAIKDRA